MGPKTFAYPMPAFLVGADVDGKPNFMAVAWGGIANSSPPMVSIALQHRRYTYKGIKKTGSFSVNIPSTDIVSEADYCGITSGAKVNKVAVCRFSTFYGELSDAPMIDECPVNLECKVVHTLNLGSHALIIGKIEQTYITETCLTGGKPDVAKIKPFIYSEGLAHQYHAFGEVIAKAYRTGRGLKVREQASRSIEKEPDNSIE
tara:strand:+ start:917 stop:1525 length:609 start_codon:yes stop_codon:yes gene_type:complete